MDRTHGERDCAVHNAQFFYYYEVNITSGDIDGITNPLFYMEIIWKNIRDNE
jgi:hypothetical protein